MPRYKLVIEYDGTPFAGWQRQLNGRSVQQAVEEAVERFAGEAVRVHCAGRTDAGVHATHQVAHLDLAHTENKLALELSSDGREVYRKLAGG